MVNQFMERNLMMRTYLLSSRKDLWQWPTVALIQTEVSFLSVFTGQSGWMGNMLYLGKLQRDLIYSGQFKSMEQKMERQI